MADTETRAMLRKILDKLATLKAIESRLAVLEAVTATGSDLRPLDERDAAQLAKSFAKNPDVLKDFNRQQKKRLAKVG